MYSNVVISANNISKVYSLYDKPHHRLTQLLSAYIHRKKANKKTENLAKEHTKSNEFWALNDVSLELREKETLGIIGQNGSGKSTLLQIICGTVSPTEGRATINGKVAALLELGAGFNPEFTGRENVYLNASIYGLGRKEVDAKMASIIEFAEIGEHIDQPVKTYSSGMYVRLAFSVIANVDAEILVIDEALAVGDAYFQQKCMRFLKKFKETGSIFFVSHDTGAMMSFCDRVMWIHKGKLVASGKPKAVCEEYLSFLHQEHSGQGNGEVPNTSLSSSNESADNVASSRSFGDGNAEILSSVLLDQDGNEINSIDKRKNVELKICVKANAELKSTIVGFIVKDRLGQYIFGDNTFANNVDGDTDMNKGDVAEVSFNFEMPAFSPGVYNIAVAVASGTTQEHVQHHWIHEAIVFNSLTSIDSGILLQIPLNQVCWKKVEN